MCAQRECVNVFYCDPSQAGKYLEQNIVSRTENSFLNLNQSFDCNYTFPVHLAPNKNLFGAKSIGKV